MKITRLLLPKIVHGEHQQNNWKEHCEFYKISWRWTVLLLSTCIFSLLLHFCEHPWLRIRFLDTWCISHIYYYYYNLFYEILTAHSFMPLITLPTRLSDTCDTLIDNIFTNNSDQHHTNCILTKVVSDHQMTCCMLSKNFIEKKHKSAHRGRHH